MKQILSVRRRSFLILTGLLFLFPTSLWATVYYVDIVNGNNGNAGTSPGTGAWKTLHYAVQHISTGDVLNVAAGTYSQASGEDGNSELTITQSDVTIQGAGASSSIVDGSGASSWYFGITIAGSNVTVRDLGVRNISGGDPSGGILITSGLGNIIEGCAIQNSDAGVRIEPSSSGNIIRNGCRIFENPYAGIYINGSDSNEIYGNRVYDNGSGPTGIYIRSGAANNKIYDNYIYDTAGMQITGIHFYWAGAGNEVYRNEIYGHLNYGVEIDNCSPTIKKNLIYDNNVGIVVSAYMGTASPVIVNNYIYVQSGAMQDGIYVVSENSMDGFAYPEILHNTIDGGTSDGVGLGGAGTNSPDIRYNIITNFGQYGIYCNPGAPTITYNNMWNNLAGSYSPGCPAGSNNISQDPLYSGYVLQDGSPCIDGIPLGAGNSTIVDDIEGNPRPQGNGYDMGCYETPASVSEVIPIPPGTQVPEYIMVSFTVQPEDPSCPGVFEDDMGGAYDSENFRIGGYDATMGTGGYRECDSGLVIQPGYAYWMLARDGLNATVDGTPTSMNDTEVPLLYSAATGNGWNQIGPPNHATYLWEDVEVVQYGAGGAIVNGPTCIFDLLSDNPMIDKRLWRWDGGSYLDNTSTLVQGEGYWVRARASNVSLIFLQSVQLAQVSNTDIMFADLWTRAKRWAKQWVLGPQTAIADSGDTPPMPMEGIATPVTEEGGGGGCLIDTTAAGILNR